MILYIDSLSIVGKIFILMFDCSYVLIHSFQLELLSLCLFVYMYWFIHIHFWQNFYLYDYLFLCTDLFIAGKTMENLRNKLTVDLMALK